MAGGASAQEIEHTHIDEDHLEALLGLDTSKIGFYADVKQKIQELGAANLDLEAKTKELQAVFDSIGDGIAIFGPDRVVHYRNDMCPRVAPGEELIGATCADLFHPGSESSPNTCPVEAALRGERRSVSFTALEEESTRYYDASATPIDGPPGRPRRVLVLLRDVTERRLRELQLLQAEKMSSIGVLAAGVAHEINNPLTSVAGYAEALLRRRRDDPEFRDDDKLLVFWDYLAVIMREAHRCKGIIDSLLTFSRKSEGVMVAVDLNPLVDEVLDLLGFDTRSENVQIVRRLARDLRPVSGDPASLRQVILNLALNAVQAIEHRGRVSIVTRNAADRVAVEVRDNGCGIAPEHLEQIWSPFFTTKPVGRGLGLGLSVSYNIVRKHGGEVSVVSQKDQGSTFTVLLPVLKEP
ncbi:MAG: PAS domain-containing protein [Deltaproteobacteria bacterium]|nr:PAS domain-containing protein [Deltaproteobacteria bacterium]